MAFPPLDIQETVPADNDFISQFPAAERTFRADLEAFLMVDHNVQGRHKAVRLDWSSDPTGLASVTTLWADSAGTLKHRVGTGAAAAVLPPGLVLPYAGSSAPEGWLLCGGQAVSRTTYAALFAVIGTTYGAGDGSTTFNVPDLRGRIPYGKDNMTGSSANRLTSAGGGIDGSTLGASGGQQNRTIAQANLPNVNLTSSAATTSTDGAHTHVARTYGSAAGSYQVINQSTPTGSVVRHEDSGHTSITNETSWDLFGPAIVDSAGAHSHTVTVTVPLGGSGTALMTPLPGVVLNYIIKW